MTCIAGILAAAEELRGVVRAESSVGAAALCPKRGKEKAPANRGFARHVVAVAQSSGISSSATILMILISGLIAGPAVSLYGSPTVSPVTAALCASEPLPP